MFASTALIADPIRVVPIGEMLDIYATSRPADAFTGDFYFVRRNENGLWFGLGDVTGHGLDSAIYMAMIQEQIEAAIDDSICCLPDVIHSLHEVMGGEMPANRFASAVFGHITTDGALQLINAGHCSPMVLRRDGSVEAFGPHGPVFGLLPRATWTSSYTRLEPGEKLLLHTDGISEAESRDGEEFGSDRVEELFRHHSASAAREIVHSVLDELDRFRGASLQADDVSIMVLGR